MHISIHDGRVKKKWSVGNYLISSINPLNISLLDFPVLTFSLSRRTTLTTLWQKFNWLPSVMRHCFIYDCLVTYINIYYILHIYVQNFGQYKDCGKGHSKSIICIYYEFASDTSFLSQVKVF